jgi:endonuclease/exonuclease/phosphatase family metal-dependent hydrolase
MAQIGISTRGSGQPPLKIMTFNIRFDNPRDSPNHWQSRKDRLVSQILYHDVDLLGVQEALYHQVVYMQQSMPQYKFVGVGRDDGATRGEFSGIFYRPDRLRLLDSSTFWLSLQPHVPGSRSWDAAITRIVTWARFYDLESGRVFLHFNTHFDHIGKEARLKSAELVLEKIKDLADTLPVVLTGDLNAGPDDPPILLLTNQADKRGLLDSKALSTSGHYGPQGTFNGFGPGETDEHPIDYILLKGPWRVVKHATISQTWQGRFASDHFAVVASLALW